MMYRDAEQVWIGLVEVMPRNKKNVLNNTPGAFTNALAYAANASDYTQIVREALSELDLVPVDFQDVEPFSVRESKFQLSGDMKELAAEVRQTKRVNFGSFYNF